MLRVVVLLSVLVGVALGQRCTGASTPEQWSGDFYESSYNFEGEGGENIRHYRRGARVNYDARGNKFHIREFYVRGSPFPDGRDREYHEQRLIFYSGETRVSYTALNGECEKETQFHRHFSPIAVPDEAEYRGTTFVGGGGYGVLHDGIKVEVFSTPRDEDDPDAPHYYGTWAPLDAGNCIPVTEAFYRAFGRFGTEDAYTGHTTFYNITAGLDPTAFTIPSPCPPLPGPPPPPNVL